MATLDRVGELQVTGMTDDQISVQLQQEGISPKEISDALNQAKIKGAVTDNPTGGIIQQPPTPQLQPGAVTPPAVAPGTPQLQQPPALSETQAPLPASGQIYQDQAAAGADQYAGYYPETGAYQDTYYQQPMMDTETITQIAEQVITEKFKNFNKETGDLVSFRTTTQDKIADIDNRLRRIETTIDKLQQAIIQKIGDFGESNAAIQKDLENLHETTSKLMNPLIDNYRAISEKKTKTTHKK